MTVEYMQAAEFEALIAQESVVVADFTASWCGPCKLVAPLMDKLGEAFAEQAKVVKVDLDANKSLAKEYSIKSIPAVLFFKDGALAETLVGVKPYSMFEETLNKYLG
jgi:thioredoxin 1